MSSSSVIMQSSDDNTEQEISMTPDKHVSIDMFSSNDQPQPVDEKNSETQCTTSTKCFVNDDPEHETQGRHRLSTNFEPVFGKEQAAKMLNAFGCQQKLAAAFDLKTKRAKEKRRRSCSLDVSRSSNKKRRRRSDYKKKKKSRKSSSRRSSANNSEKRMKRKRDSTHGSEISPCKVLQPKSPKCQYSFDSLIKAFPITKYSSSPRLNIKDSKPKKKKRSTFEAKLDKEKRKKSMDRNSEKIRDKEKRRRRSGSKSSLNKTELNLSSKSSTIIGDRMKVEVKVKIKTNPEQKSPNSEEYVSDWDDWDYMDDLTDSSMESIMSLDTIPLTFNIPKQDRSILYTNDCSIKANDEFNEVTPPMTEADSMVSTPILSSNSFEINSQSTVSQLVDSEYGNGDTASIELLDEVIASNDDELEIEASKKSLEKKFHLHDIEHSDSKNSVAKINESDLSPQLLDTMESKPSDTITANDSSDSSSSSTSSSSSNSSSASSTSSVSRKKQMKKKNRKQEDISNVMLSIDENIFNLKGGIEDDELSDYELMSKVEQLKQRINEKRKAVAKKRKLTANNTYHLATSNKSDVSPDALLSPEKRPAISLKIGNAKSNSMKVKPVTLDNDDFTKKLLLEVTSTPNTVARAKETNKLLLERVIEPEVGMVSSSNSNSLASEIINTKVTRIGILPPSDIFGKNHPSSRVLPLKNAITKIHPNQTYPMDTSEMKIYLNNATMSHFDSSDSITSKTSASVDSSTSNNSFRAVIHKESPVTHQSLPPRSDKRDLSDLSSITRLTSPHQRSRTKDTSRKRHYSPPPLRHCSPLPRRRSSHRSQSYDFQQASGAYMNQQPSQLPHNMARQHVAPHVQHHMIQNPLPLPQPLPSQQRFSNLIEIRQSSITEVEPTPFVLKENVLEIVPNTESIAVQPLTDSVASKLTDRICEMKVDIKVKLTEEKIQLRELQKAEIELKLKQKREKKHLERVTRKEKLRLEIKDLTELIAPIPVVEKASYNPIATGGKNILRLVAPGSNKKSVLFADGVAPGDGTSTSGGENVASLLRDRNKRMTRGKASIVKKAVVPQITEIKPFIDPELENMPPPPPPAGSPSARLAQPKLKSTPNLIYFHYDEQSKSMHVSPYPTADHIPQKPSDKKFSAITKLPTDSPSASSTPDQFQRPKVCFVQPPTQETGPILPNSNQQPPPPSTATNFIGSVNTVNAATALPPVKLLNQQPSSTPLLNSSVVHPQRHPQSILPQNYQIPVPPVGQQSIQVQPTPMQMQPLVNMAQWDNSRHPMNSPQFQQQPFPQIWESDIYFPQTLPIRPSERFINSNNIPQQRPSRNPWDQQRHPTPLFQNFIHSSQSSFGHIQSNPFSQQQSNNFAFNSNNHPLHYNSQRPNRRRNRQYRNNH